MSEDRNRDEDPLAGFWITNWEQQCIHSVETETDLEGQLQNERDLSNQKIWFLFQNSATAVAQLFKERIQGDGSTWIPFQTAAGSVTALYKESCDSSRRCTDLGVQVGYQRRNRELLNWVRKKRRNICREDLISYLAGKNTPHTHKTQPRMSPRPRLSMDHMSSRPSNTPITMDNNTMEDNLHIFTEALGSAMPSCRRRSSPLHHSGDLSQFITGEIARHTNKRPSSPSHDVNMDSPTHKRSRLF